MFSSITQNDGEWYVIRVISGTEENVRQSLLQRREAFNLENFLLEIFVPTHDSVTVKTNGEKVKKKKNIFPGYILVKMIVTNESWYIVRNTPNVTGFLGAGTVPVPVRGEELEQLKGVLSQKSEEYKTNFKLGDFIVVSTGPFEGSDGKIIEINQEKGVLKVNVNILGRDTPLELDFANAKAKK
ncbi:MAG: transcription termination/antitermination protein NusG [Candidatus Gracilibacteria bacterium]|nr:transcription termination/antitermination protein NusG [Candidatus Gracilibacteria bacterium]MDD2908906.1 transcription termination/antitermination protein NusG [Candidatus Gracilibacteria bacterium]